MFFYASWKPVYLLLILGSIVVNFTLGRKLARCQAASRRPWLIFGVCFNMGLLGYFKYTGFFLDGLNEFGLWLLPVPEITLPLAISFFTFQQIAYLVDVARGDCKEYQFHHYALFVLFFPQLIAGPIVHHSEMMPQFDRLRPRAQIPTDLAVGLTLIAIGLFKKVVLADNLGLVADPVFAAAAQGKPLHSLDALIATFAFSFQIYFDFSGYSDIAIGSARLFGITLPENFRSPYRAASIIEIWRRWHMTLSRFLKDYLYIALGGNRRGTAQRYRNLFLTMLLGGLWHGAAWTYVAWGGLHGLYLCWNHAWRYLIGRLGLRNFFALAAWQPLFIALTFTAWSVALVIFRAEGFDAGVNILASGFVDFSSAAPLLLSGVFNDGLAAQMAQLANLTFTGYGAASVLLGAAGLVCWALPSSQSYLAEYQPVLTPDMAPLPATRLVWRPTLAYAALSGLALLLALLNIASVSRFIYFQF
ncbi:MAG: MBOAT family O-acyltransferase [Halioglobus sp.]